MTRDPDRTPAMLTGPASAALALASGAADAAELRGWLQMAGLLPEDPVPESGRPARRADKRCPRCQTVKPASQWHRDKGHPDGLATYCKTCQAAYVRDRVPAGERREKARGRYRRSRAGKPDLRLKENRPLHPRPAPAGRRTLHLALPPELAGCLAADASASGTAMTAVARGILAGHYALAPAPVSCRAGEEAS